MRRSFRLLAAPMAALLLLTGCAQGGGSETFAFHSSGGKTEIFYDQAERKPVEDFSGESLMEPGKEIRLSDFEGQIVVLNAWGQWCAPCRAEIDDLQEAHEELERRGTGTVLGINVRDYQPEISRDFISDNHATYPSIYDPPFKTASFLGGVPSSVIPTTIVLDAQHRPAAVFLREVTAQDLLDVVDTLEKEDDA